MNKFSQTPVFLRILFAAWLAFLPGLSLVLVACGDDTGGSSSTETSGANSPLTSDKQFVLTLVEAAAPVLNLTSDQLQSRIQAHQSLAEIAQTQQIEVAILRQALLNKARTQLDAAVKAGKLSQTTADQQFQTFASSSLDTLITTHFGS